MKRILSLAVISILGGLVAHVGVFTFIRIEFPQRSVTTDDGFAVQYVGDTGIRANPALGEQVFLQDSAPLFMPTKWNLVSRMDDVASLREATEVFSQYPPLLTLPDSSAGSMPAPVPVETLAEAALPDLPSFYLARFGRRPDGPLSGTSSGASLLSIPLGTAVDRDLRVSSLPEGLIALSPGTLWPPVRFYLHLIQGMPLGEPVIDQSSGFTDWDHALQDYIGSLAYYRSLKSGYYRITVFP